MIIIGTISADANGFIPRTSSAINYYGIGIIAASKETIIHSAPDESSEIKELITLKDNGIKTLSQTLRPIEAFVVFLPKQNLAFLSVTDENDNWYEVVYNQKAGLKGWIKKTDRDNFMSWAEFLKIYGKEKGLYFFSDIPLEFKTIHTSPSETSQSIKDVYYANDNNIQLHFVSGNWLLATFIDYDNSSHIGWVRWRDDSGKIYVFPNFEQN